MAEEMKKIEGTENVNEQNQDRKAEGYSRNPFKRAGNWIKKFPENHPRIWKGIKIGGCVVGAAGIGAGAYVLGKNSGQKSDETPETTDTFLPVMDDTPELPMNDDLVPIEELVETIETVEPVSEVISETVEA